MSDVRFGDGLGAGFLEDLLTEDLGPRRRALLEHPLWTGVLAGTVTRAQLARFAVQDAWLIRQIAWLDGTLIARAPTLEAADLLVAKLTPKSGALDGLVAFGEAFGATRAEIEAPVPIAGCAALTSLFVYQLMRGTFAEAFATLAASETIFIEICGRIEAPLRDHYGLSPEALAFVSFHDLLDPIGRSGGALLSRLVRTEQERSAVTEAVALLYDTEKLFYDAIVG